MEIVLRDVRLNDAKRISEIYRPYVENTAITFETEAPDEAEMEERIRSHAAYPYLVLEKEGRVIGYAYAGKFKQRQAYLPTVEVSVYLDENERGNGLGRRLMEELLIRLKADDRYFTALACITSPNTRSERLFASLGFRLAGEYECVGYKMGKWRGVKDFVLPLKPYDRQPNMN